MPFSPSVRREALIAAARYCCVCHRYKGVKVEVHHIVPESQGGFNDLENAIVLCFDCHADAGHYNPEHPRGTKFSPDELRNARDSWHMMVSANRIHPPEREDAVYCRYLLCRSFIAIAEICQGNLESIPVPNPLLVNNQVGEFQRTVVARYGSKDRLDQLWGDSFTDVEAYSKIHPYVRVFERSSFPYYPYFRAIRIPGAEEIRKRVSIQDPISEILLNTGESANEICRAMAYDELCGDSCFQEIYYLRPFWATYLEVRNLGEQPLRINSVQGLIERPGNASLRPFLSIMGSEGELTLPLAQILPGQSVLIPVASLVGPLDMSLPEGTSREVADLDTGQVQEIEHTNYSALVRHTAVIGPAIWPQRLRLDLDEMLFEQPVHEFDLSNLYTINRFWEAGSCPHLFFVNHQGRTSYHGELFAKAPFTPQVRQLVIPPGIDKCIVAELEAEKTWLGEIHINGRSAIENQKLSQGEKVVFEVASGDELLFYGWYEPEDFVATKKPNPLLRNSLIYHFLNEQRQLTTGSS